MSFCKPFHYHPSGVDKNNIVHIVYSYQQYCNLLDRCFITNVKAGAWGNLGMLTYSIAKNLRRRSTLLNDTVETMNNILQVAKHQYCFITFYVYKRDDRFFLCTACSLRGNFFYAAHFWQTTSQIRIVFALFYSLYIFFQLSLVTETN